MNTWRHGTNCVVPNGAFERLDRVESGQMSRNDSCLPRAVREECGTRVHHHINVVHRRLAPTATANFEVAYVVSHLGVGVFG